MEEMFEKFKRMDLVTQKLKECPYIENYIYNAEPFRDYDSEVINDKDKRVRCITYFTSAKFFDVFDIPILDGEIPESLHWRYR